MEIDARAEGAHDNVRRLLHVDHEFPAEGSGHDTDADAVPFPERLAGVVADPLVGIVPAGRREAVRRLPSTRMLRNRSFSSQRRREGALPPGKRVPACSTRPAARL